MSTTGAAATPLPFNFFNFSTLTAENLTVRLSQANTRETLQNWSNADQIEEICREFIVRVVPVLAQFTAHDDEGRGRLSNSVQRFLVNRKIGQDRESLETERARLTGIYGPTAEAFKEKGFSPPETALAWAALDFLMSDALESTKAWHLCLHAEAIGTLHPDFSAAGMQGDVFWYFQSILKDRKVL